MRFKMNIFTSKEKVNMDVLGVSKARAMYEHSRAIAYKKALIENNIELPELKSLSEFIKEMEEG